MHTVPFDHLHNADLIVDAIYEGGARGNAGDDPISCLLKVGNQGGFRKCGSGKALKHLVLYTSGEEGDWPDSINPESGLFEYFGDNRSPGKELHATARGGNRILKYIFDSLHANIEPRTQAPPIFVFQKHPTQKSSRSVQFKGLCAPGAKHLNATDDLIAIWKTTGEQRFQNYKAIFTILNIPVVSRSWIECIELGDDPVSAAPREWSLWRKNGTYVPLLAPRTRTIRTPSEQLPTKSAARAMLSRLHGYFADDPHQFEECAARLYSMSNSRVRIDEVTRNVIDGGRDAIGTHRLGLDSDPIHVEFALEAKCYDPGLNSGKMTSVGVKDVARLISRIRNRQYGVIVTTSVIATQAYQEVRNDEHPIILICGSDLIDILISKGITTTNMLTDWLETEFPREQA